MKKFLVIFSILFMFFATTCSQVLADARWYEPRNIKTYIPDHPKKDLMKKAFGAWTKATNGKIVFKYIDNPKQAHIKVNFVRDIYDLTGDKTAIGLTRHQSQGEYMIFAEIIISERSPNGALFRNDAVYRVMVHEIGHAIGIFEHAPAKESIMYYSKASRYATITKYDVDYVKRLYKF
jgi:predicted Zn-dependent protease